jgi:N-acetylneuraminate synthase/pseudaminic acid synthase
MQFKIEDVEIGEGQPTYIIAEMSANHGGSLETAIKIIHAAKRAGADAIKLQTYRADTITLDSDKEDFQLPKDSPWRDSKNLYALYDEGHTPWEWHQQLFEEARKVGIHIFSAPFDNSAVDLLESLDCPVYKIASPEINDIALIKRCAQTKKPVILSTGVANIIDVERAIKVLIENGCENYAFLKCTTAYPAPLEDANLGAIPLMKERYKCLVGLSDHTIGSLVPVLSVAMGASIIEKHFTLDDGEETIDSFFSLTETKFAEMVKQVRDSEKTLGTQIEMSNASIKNTRGRRSLYVCDDIEVGTVITNKNIKSVRPSLGLSPRHFERVIGKTVTKRMERGDRLDLSSLDKNIFTSVSIYCDANSIIGTGHVKRSVSLANFLNKNDFNIKVYPLSNEAQKLIPESLVTLNKDSDIVILDTPTNYSVVIKDLKVAGKKVIAMDIAEDCDQDCTILVYEHKKLNFSNRFTGFEYTIIRDEFKAQKRLSTPVSNLNVLVMLGGGDIKNESIIVSSKLAEFGCNVNLVVGPLMKVPEDLPSSILVHSNPNNIAELMADCDWAISNGGGSLFELLYLNKPTHVLAQTIAEETIAKQFLERESILGLGLDQLKKYSISELKTTVSKINNIIDGEGTGRIQMILEGLCDES